MLFFVFIFGTKVFFILKFIESMVRKLMITLRKTGIIQFFFMILIHWIWRQCTIPKKLFFQRKIFIIFARLICYQRPSSTKLSRNVEMVLSPKFRKLSRANSTMQKRTRVKFDLTTFYLIY